MDRMPSAVSAGGLKESAEERALLSKISNSKPQQDAQATAQEDRPQQPRISNTSSISSALQQHALAAQRRGPSHMPPASADQPSKRSKHAPSKPDAPHSSTPQAPAVSSPGQAAVHLTPELPTSSTFRQGASRSAAQPPQSLAIPGVVAPGPMPPKGPVPLPSNLGTSAWPVLPYLENVEHAIAHADSQPLTFHRSVSRPLSDFLTAVMHSLGVQDACYTGLGTYLIRAFIADHCAARLAVYEGLQRYAASSNWQGFLIAALEYIESAGYDTARLFKNVNKRRRHRV